MKTILTSTTKAEVEFHGCAADEIAGILFLLDDLAEGRILLAETRGNDHEPKTAAEHGSAFIVPIDQARAILNSLMDTAAALGACRG